jgi:hypothetical protein
MRVQALLRRQEYGDKDGDYGYLTKGIAYASRTSDNN